MIKLLPNEKVPNIKIPTIGKGEWNMSKEEAENFYMLVFYRGYHCPICRAYLNSLNTHISGFEELGVNVVTLSCDTQERAAKTMEKWSVNDLAIGYGLTPLQAREWGLFLSQGISESEPAVFSEPGVFLVNPDRTLFGSSIQSMPFVRPAFEDLKKSIEYVIKEKYPARGEAK